MAERYAGKENITRTFGVAGQKGDEPIDRVGGQADLGVAELRFVTSGQSTESDSASRVSP
jgi:hypothetical protein